MKRTTIPISAPVALALFFALLGNPPSLRAQVFNGDLFLSTQAEIDAFNATEVTGSLDIFDIGTDPIVNLDGLQSITSIGGNLVLRFNIALTNLNGLHNLTSLGGELFIRENNALTNLSGLHNLDSIPGDVTIFSNCALTSLTGLHNIGFIGGNLTIEFNCALTSLTSLQNLTSVGGGLSIRSNSALTSLSGLQNITSIPGTLNVSEHLTLTSLNGLHNISFIGGNFTSQNNILLTSLNGLDNLTSVAGNLLVFQNLALTSLNGLDNLASVGGNLTLVRNNALPNLVGLGKLTSIGGNLTIQGSSPAIPLPNLNGLQSLTSIGGNLFFAIGSLTDFDALQNLTSVGGNLGFFRVTGLASLAQFCGLYPLLAVNGVGGSASFPSGITAAAIVAAGPCTPAGYVVVLNVLIKKVVDLVTANVLRLSQGNALNNKLNSAIKQLEKGNTRTALAQLRAFVNQVNDFINDGILTALQGQPLINTANNVIVPLNSSLAKLGDEDVPSRLESTSPMQFVLEQNYPNPFNPETEIRFALPAAGQVTVRIFSITGQEVRTLANSSFEAGYHTLRWDGRDQSGHVVATGLYVYRLLATGENGEVVFTQTKRMALLK